jgi:hypothetical protein
MHQFHLHFHLSPSASHPPLPTFILFRLPFRFLLNATLHKYSTNKTLVLFGLSGRPLLEPQMIRFILCYSPSHNRLGRSRLSLVDHLALYTLLNTKSIPTLSFVRFTVRIRLSLVAHLHIPKSTRLDRITLQRAVFCIRSLHCYFTLKIHLPTKSCVLPQTNITPSQRTLSSPRSDHARLEPGASFVVSLASPAFVFLFTVILDIWRHSFVFPPSNSFRTISVDKNIRIRSADQLASRQPLIHVHQGQNVKRFNVIPHCLSLLSVKGASLLISQSHFLFIFE